MMRKESTGTDDPLTSVTIVFLELAWKATAVGNQASQLANVAIVVLFNVLRNRYFVLFFI